MCTNPAFGGYPGLAREKLPESLDIGVEYIPQNTIYEINEDLALEKIDSYRKLNIVMLTSSMTIFPQNFS